MIIDTHVHFGEALHFNVIEAMDKYNISTAIVSNTHSSECDFDQKLLPPSLQTSMIESAIEAIKFAKDYPKKIYAAIWVKPLQEKPSAELFQLIKQNKNFVKAIKFHPFHSSIPFDDPKCEEFIQMAKELNLLVITHSANDRCSECKRVLNMAKKYPSVSFVMAHMGLGTNNEAAIQMCRQQENLFGDTAWVPFENTIKFIKDVGSEKIMFGSDMPIDGIDTYAKNPKGEPSMYVPYFNELQNLIPSKDYENLMFKNAQDFYKI